MKNRRIGWFGTTDYARTQGLGLNPGSGRHPTTLMCSCGGLIHLCIVPNVSELMQHPLTMAGKGREGNYLAFVSNSKGNGQTLEAVPVGSNPLTVEGELNKLASNISIGRNWAGVHYFSDYVESLRMGEQIAIGILEEQKLTYRENFSMTVPLFDGGSIRI